MYNDIKAVLRLIRVRRNIGLKDMAEKLGLSPSYLSAIENNNRNIPFDLEDKICSTFDLNDEEKEELKAAIISSGRQIKVDTKHMDETEKRILYALINEEIDEATLTKMCEIIDKKVE